MLLDQYIKHSHGYVCHDGPALSCNSCPDAHCLPSFFIPDPALVPSFKVCQKLNSVEEIGSYSDHKRYSPRRYVKKQEIGDCYKHDHSTSCSSQVGRHPEREKDCEGSHEGEGSCNSRQGLRKSSIREICVIGKRSTQLLN